MRFVYVLTMAVLIIGTANAWTFHGDVQRTGNFSAVNGSDLIWKAKIGGLVDSSPVVRDGRVYVLSWYGSWYGESSKLSCLYAKNGTEVWNASIEGASTPTVYKNLVVVGDLSGKLHCFNASNGEELWNVTLESNPNYYGISSSPLIYNDTIYVTTFSNGTLWALDLNGSVKWNVTTGGKISYYTSPSAYNGLIFFAGNYSGINELVCVNESGFVQWKFTVDSMITSSIAIEYGNAYFTTENRIYAINVSTHEEIWNVSINGTISTPAIAYGKVFVGSKDGYLYCFDAFNGREIWRFKANGKIDSSPAVGGDIVYFATNTQYGTIYALNIEDGSLVWKYTLIPPQDKYYNIMSSPFIWNGKLFIGADDGNLYCFGKLTTLWEGTVTIVPANITLTLDDNSKVEINETTALASLVKASMLGGFNIKIRKQSGRLFVSSINGFEENDKLKWYCSVNGNLINDPANYTLNDGDTVVWMYGIMENDKTYIDRSINYTVKMGPVGITNLTVSNAKLGGNATAYVNVTSLSDNWYVVVVSGLNENGDYIAGISTFYLPKGQSLSVPVLLHVPQRNTVGTYRLFAGVYRLNEYPNNLIDWFGSVSCEVSR